jgi:hypothetical protein
MGILLSELLLRVSDNGLGKTEEKLTSWGKLSTTKDLRARKLKSLNIIVNQPFLVQVSTQKHHI